MEANGKEQTGGPQEGPGFEGMYVGRKTVLKKIWIYVP